MASRTDGNQSEIVSALRQAGYSVCCLHEAGHGVPDLLVGGYQRFSDGSQTRTPFNWLLEVKTEKGKLTGDQVKWHAAWRGQVAIVRSVDEALRVVGVLPPQKEG